MLPKTPTILRNFRKNSMSYVTFQWVHGRTGFSLFNCINCQQLIKTSLKKTPPPRPREGQNSNMIFAFGEGDPL